MGRFGKAAILGLLTAAIGLTAAALPPVSALEDSLALRWLFFVRGAIEPPPAVVIVSIDEEGATRRGLPPRLLDWPRSVHGELVDRLVARGASVVAFDVVFLRHSPQPAEDERFAAAIARARRVALVQRFRTARVEGRETWQRQDPIPILAHAALALAPVPVPDAPLVTSFWSFLSTPQAGEVPALPAVMLQIHALPLLAEFLELLERAGVAGLDALPRDPQAIVGAGDLLTLMQTIRRNVSANRSAQRRLSEMLESSGASGPAVNGPLLTALIAVYTSPREAFLNFYGPPGSICTVRYEDVLGKSNRTNDRCSFPNSAVLVGAGPSRVARADQTDTYHTIYASVDGTDFSGVEIHATAFANLLSGNVLRPVQPAFYFLVLLFCGTLLGSLAYFIRTRRRPNGKPTVRLQAAGVAIGVAALYGVISYMFFARLNLVVPLVIPLLIQLPAALIVALVSSPTRHTELVKAVCLVTDAAGSTALGERLDHRTYNAMMSEYRDALCQVVQHRGGEALNPKGDGFLCLWRQRAGQPASERGDAAMRLQACLAALEMSAAAEQFNGHQPLDRRLPTRIGLHVGIVTVSADADRGTYDVQGQPANLAERLQKLNATMRTRVLASDAVIEGLEDRLVLRRIEERVTLDGISHPPGVFEIVGRRPVAGGVTGAAVPVEVAEGA